MNNSNAVFLDRDGVLNLKKDDYVKNLSELEIFPFIAKSMKKLQQSNFKLIVITNQSAMNLFGIRAYPMMYQHHNHVLGLATFPFQIHVSTEYHFVNFR